MARSEGIACHILGDALEGEARDLALAHAGIAQSVARHGAPFAAPCLLLSGGEATVTLRGEGRGGRNTEFALALALALEHAPAPARVHALSAGTDGLDGRAGAAGAWIAPDTLARARAEGLAPRDMLDRNDSASLFDRLGALVHTGPTHTNVNDFRAILIEAT
jgi:hydroxypyruvate reductase